MASITDETILNPVNPQVENSVINSETKVAQEYKTPIKGPYKDTLNTSLANELVSPSQGVGERLLNETEYNFFILRSLVPKDQTVMYGKIVIEYNPWRQKHITPA